MEYSEGEMRCKQVYSGCTDRLPNSIFAKDPCRHSKGRATKVTFCSDHYSIQVQARNMDTA